MSARSDAVRPKNGQSGAGTTSEPSDTEKAAERAPVAISRNMQAVKRRMLEQGLTLSEVARRSGLSRATLTRLMQGTRYASFATAEKLAQTLEMPWVEVMGVVGLGASPNEVTVACVKCGREDISISWHEDRWRCGWNERLSPDPGEHLHYHCRTCRYHWHGPTKEQEAVSGERHL